MSTKVPDWQIRGADKELRKAAKRTQKRRRITQQIRISRPVAIRLREHARAEKRTMSKVADELIEAGLPRGKYATGQKREKGVTKPFSAKSVFANL